MPTISPLMSGEDIENFRSTADGQIFRSLAYDDDNFVVRSLNFI